MPSEQQIEFFARWSEAARQRDREADLAKSMSDRLQEALVLSKLVAEVRRGVDVRPG